MFTLLNALQCANLAPNTHTWFSTTQTGPLFWKMSSRSRDARIPSRLMPVGGSRRAAVSQTVKVKAETSPVPKTQPLLDRVQLDWTNPEKTIQKSLTWRGRKTGKKEKKSRRAPNFCSPLSEKNCLPVLTFFASTTRETPPKHKVEREKCEATGLCVCNQAPGLPINPCSTVQWYVNMGYYCF